MADRERDVFPPPDIPIEVFCYHCGEEYETWQMRPEEDDEGATHWHCATPGCDGRGFLFDIWPIDPEWRDEHGELVWIEDDDDEADWEDGLWDRDL